MRCNLCSGVLYCVKQKTEGNITRRIYRCKKCHNVFHTVEKIEHCPFYTEEGCGIQDSPPSQWDILKEDPVEEKLLY